MLASYFEAQVRNNPLQIAVKTESKELTYGELNWQANQIARQLQNLSNNQQAQGIEVVGLLFEHGSDMIVGTLGALKAGKIYVPLDPEYPKERLMYILQDAGVKMLVTNTLNLKLVQNLITCLKEKEHREIRVFNIDDVDPLSKGENLDLPIPGDQIAYLLYTSGSTGQPKGVIQTHENVSYFIHAYQKNLQLTPTDRLTLFSAFNHDAAIIDIFSGFLSGATLYPVNIKKIDFSELAECLQQEKITVYHSVPTVYRYFLQALQGSEEFSHLRYIVLGGEEVRKHDIEMFQNQFGSQTVLINLYGQSESSYNSSQYYQCSTKVTRVTLGEPNVGTEFLVINEDGDEVEPLEVGEIVVLSKHVALGYWHDSEKTIKAFGESPDLGRFYRTGDLGRVMLDGSIEFMGRRDFQVKIRGFRVELGEIESKLLAFPGIKDTVVIAKKSEKDETYLCTFFVQTGDVSEKKLREFLYTKLPEYMLPTQFVELEQIPVTPNNKVDRKALQELERNIERKSTYQAPVTEAQMTLTAILQEILPERNIGIDDNILELGLHSLRAVTLVSRVYKEFQVKLGLKEIFAMPTIRELAFWIEGAKREQYDAIEVVAITDNYPVSSAQKRLLLLNQLEGDTTNYNLPKIFWLEGKFDPKRFELAIQCLIERHESLRTSFIISEGELRQKVHNQIEFHLEKYSVEEREIPTLLQKFVRPFDLRVAPLLRVALVQCGEKNLLCFDIHHIISDGTSMAILVDELVKLYAGQELPPLKVQYKDFAVWQQQFLQSEKIKKQEEYLLQEFSGELPVLNMSTDYPRPARLSSEGAIHHFRLDKELTERLQFLAKSHNATLYMVLLGIFSTVLARYAGQEEILIGTVTAGRTQVEIEPLIGVFLNNILFRCRPTKEKSFAQYLDELQVKVINGYENQNYPIEELIAKLNPMYDQSRHVLFDVMLILQNFEKREKEITLEEFSIYPYQVEHTSAKYDLTLYAAETFEGIGFNLEYSTRLFAAESMVRFGKHFQQVACEIAIDPSQQLGTIKMLTLEEEKEILYSFNDTEVEYAKDQMIHQLFKAQVERSPEKVALISHGSELTYRELNNRANQLAHRLREYGIGPEQIVGIMVERSPEMIIAILAVLKAGGAYLPLDSDYPAERLSYMLEDSKASLLLTQQHLKEKITFHGTIIELSAKALDRFTTEQAKAAIELSHNLENYAKPTDLAYIIYTSGSTGQPKGVMVERRNLLAYVHAFQREFSMSEEDVVLQQASYSFDTIVEELYPVLLAGGTMVIPKKYEIADPIILHQLLSEYQITIISCSPLLLNVLNQIPPVTSLRLLISGGDVLKAEYISNLNKSVKIYNTYGPTETTVCATYYRCPEFVLAMVPIGKPIANYRIYIVDGNNQLLPIGVPGELCIAGEGVTRGYLYHSELTEEKFIMDPFVAGSRMYKTSDLARWLSDGNIEFLGRIDAQVKIRGYRIELGEIENQLLQHEAIAEAVVVAQGEGEGKLLSAYVVVRDGNELTTTMLRTYLAQSLPDYMIPAYFIMLDHLPITSNGKIDRKALPIPEENINLGTEYIAPTTEVEIQLSEIWSQLLGHTHIGIRDNFFALGGHSLKATVLIARVAKEMGVELPLRQIFTTPTIEELAQYIETLTGVEYTVIPVLEEQDYYALSSAQKRMYILNQLNPESTNYNLPCALYVRGSIERKRFNAAFTTLVQRHESFRTSFCSNSGEIMQCVHREVPFSIEWLEISHQESEKLQQYIESLIQPFDLSQAPLLRVKVIQLEEQCVLFTDMHHIIADGFSVDILINEFLNLYEGNSLPEIRIQYKDFAAWQNQFFTSEQMQKQEDYWLDIFSGELPVLNLLTDFQRQSMRSLESSKHEFILDAELSEHLYRLTRETGTTLYMVLLAAYTALLAKYTGQDDIIVGSPIAGRPHADLANLIGMFVNTLAFRTHPTSKKTFYQYLAEVKEYALSAYEHQDYQFEMLVEKLGLTRDLSRNPLFDTVFTLQNMNLSEKVEHSLHFSRFDIADSGAKFDLALYAFESGSEIYFCMQYATQLFKADTIKRMSQHLVQLIGALIANPHVPLENVDYLTEEEKYQLIYGFNDTEVAYPYEKVMQQFVEEQVERTPDKVAIVDEDQQITYREMNARANQLARTLRVKGTGPECVVGIFSGGSIDMLIGVLAIVKAGGAYLPIDPNYPVNRIEYMLADSGAMLLLAHAGIADSACSAFKYQGEILHLDDQTLYTDNEQNLNNVNHPKDLIYIIYTSGSTGNPKGVMIEHWNVNRLLSDKVIELTIRDHFLQSSSLAFDVSTYEIWGNFSTGSTMYMTHKEDLLSAKRMANKIQKYGIKSIWITTALFSQLVEEDSAFLTEVDTVAVGGEALQARYVNLALLKNPELLIFNCYGPTESTTFTTYHQIDHMYDGNISIGVPIANTQVYILDSFGHLQPIGVPGELCIGGDGLARGYLNRAELTAEKFIPHPFISGQKIYKSGDLARWMPDGTIEFLGRMDHQVKIRGYRIELGEVEKGLLQHPAIKEVVVKDYPDEQGIRYLAAYFVAERELLISELREYMLKHLPEYMVPSYFTQMAKLPITPNGKVDHRALPKPDKSMKSSRTIVPPVGYLEEQLSILWKDILGLDIMGVTENFFELGGHSLKATAMISRIYKELQVDIPLREVFKTPTIRGLSAYIAQAQRETYQVIQPVNEREYYPTSSAQKRMYVLQQMDLTSTVYNIPLFLRIDGDLDVERLREVFQALLRRHESFRTSFAIVENELVQYIHPLTHLDINLWEASEDEFLNIMEEFIKPFELSQAPLLRVGIVKRPDEFLLMMDMHHIISDGVSMGIFMEDFIRLYAGVDLPELRIQYKDYAEWQKDFLTAEILQKEEEYWLEQFAGEIPVLNLPTDYPRPAVVGFAGKTHNFTISEELTNLMQKLAHTEGATLYMVLLAAYNLLLAKYTGQDDIIVGSPIAGRPHPDLEQIIGMFVNTLAMRNKPVQQKTFRQFLAEVKETALKAYENQNYQFEKLVEKLQLERSMSRNALIDTMFALQNLDYRTIEAYTVESLRITPYLFTNQIAKFDLSLTLAVNSGQFKASIEYKTDLFSAETIARLATHYTNILNAISLNPDLELCQVEMLSLEEKTQVLHEFNQTLSVVPSVRLLHQLFEEQVDLQPTRVAVRYEDQYWTYGELNARANLLAHFLRRKGVQPNEIIGIIAEPSLELASSLLGILKSGAAYLPISPKFPKERIEYMLQDSGVRILLMQKTQIKDLKFAGEIVDVSLVSNAETNPLCKENPLPLNQPEDLAYVIYTSGTTGKPKGVLIEHRGVTNTLCWQRQEFKVSPADRILQLLAFTFDGFVASFFTPIISGAEAIFMHEEDAKDPIIIRDVIRNSKVTAFLCVPSLYHNILECVTAEDVSSFRIIFLGAERVTPALVALHQKKIPDVILVNEYGPTENSVISTAQIGLKPEEVITIGRPISNTQVYILDKGYNPVPIGVPGEMYLAGEGLARGYLNRSELTTERFIPNPFGTERIYRTGDLARWLADGRIDFIGRVDHQVKIRGFRIELGEIEAQLLKHPAIKEVVVIDLEDDSLEKYLVAYYVLGEYSDTTINGNVAWDETLKTFLAKELPEYMIPTYLIQLDDLPRTVNGKVDRKALPMPEGKIESGVAYVAPRNAIEETLVEIWSEILKIKQIGIDDNFFKLGGHSLKATSVVARVYKDFEIILPLKVMFQTPTIRGLAQYLQQAGNVVQADLILDETEAEVEEQMVMQIPQTDIDTLKVSTESVCLKGVLLTGVTGFLGAHILESLLTSTDAVVYCLVRAVDQVQAEKRLREMINFYFDGQYNSWIGERIYVLRGDVTEANLGLEIASYANLGQSIDTVIHTAALVKHFGDYAKFAKINVDGTEEVIRLAETHRCRLFHISTVSVSGTAVKGEDVTFTENDFYIGQNYTDNVYVKSKFVSENRIYQAMQRGVNATICRVGNLTGRYRDGHFQANVEENAFHSQFKAIVELGVVSEEMDQDAIEFTPVDLCSKALVAIAQTKEAVNRVFHLYNSYSLGTQELVAIFKSLGIDIQRMNVTSFREFIHSVMKSEKAELLTLTLAYAQVATNSEYTGRVRVDSSITQNYLQQLGFTWPRVDAKYMQKILDYLRKVGFISSYSE